MPTSTEWKRYFDQHQHELLDLPWDQDVMMSDDERRAIARSIQEFQVGESSEGMHLLKYAKRWAVEHDDPDYFEAVKLFIAEEHRHARDLGRVMKLAGIPRVKTTSVDRVFRWMRNLLGNLEMSIAVLVTAEIIAKVYYAALRDATGSPVLQQLCRQILIDEVAHVEFQTEQLRRLREGRSLIGRVVTSGLQRLLFFVTVPIVYRGHRKALRRGGLTAWTWWLRCWLEFEDALGTPRPTHALAVTS